MEWFETDKLKIKVGVETITHSNYFDLQQSDSKFSISLESPKNDKGLLESLSHSAAMKSLYVELDGIDLNQESIYFYFGDQLGGIDEYLLIQLKQVISEGRRVQRWVSKRGNDTPGYFGWFVNNFWGVGLLRFIILSNKRQPLSLSNSGVLQFVIPAKNDIWRESIYHKLIFEELSFKDSSNPLSAIRRIASVEDHNKLSSKLSDTDLNRDILQNLGRAKWLIEDICQNPTSKLRLKLKSYGIDAIENELLDYGFEEVVEIELNQSSNGIVMNQCTVESLELTANINENQMVLLIAFEFLHILILKLESTRLKLLEYGEIRKKIWNKHEAYNKRIEHECKTYEGLLGDYKRMLSSFEYLIEEHRTQNKIALDGFTHFSSTNVTEYDLRYAELVSLHELLFSKLVVSKLDQGVFEFQTGALQKLYEKWAIRQFMLMFDSDHLGFIQHEAGFEEFVQGDYSAVRSFYHKDDVNLILNVYAEKRYERHNSWNEEYGVVGQKSSFNRFWCQEITNYNAPDLSVEIFHDNIFEGRYPFILTFDPTISASQYAEGKSKYLTSIFCFDNEFQDENGDPAPLVRASWGIYPGTLIENKLENNERALNKDFRGRFRESANRGNKSLSSGVILLYPGCETNLKEIFINILSRTVFFNKGIKVNF